MAFIPLRTAKKRFRSEINAIFLLNYVLTKGYGQVFP